MMNLIKAYLRVSLVTRIIVGFLLGAAVGGFLWYLSVTHGVKAEVQQAMRYCSPFGSVFISMLKMIVIPIVFFSLVGGSASLPLKKLGRAGGKVIGWYFATMAFAAMMGITLARFVNPGSGSSLEGWKDLVKQFGSQAPSAATAPASLVDILEKLLMDFFQNPFAALSQGNFLGVIVFAILFGISIRLVVESTDDEKVHAKMQLVIDFFDACMLAINRIIDFVMNYSPIGVFFLAMVIFSVYGPVIIGPYVTVLVGVACGILGMLFIAYPILIAVVVRKNPYKVIKASREAMLMAFVTRSSAATLPVSIRVAEENLKVNRELASFSLPLGSTINMDGVCIHLPMFAILAANMFGIHLSFGDMALMTITTVLAAVGTGGVPGGSLMLLFIILGGIGLDSSQIAVIVALAIGINPILDMFETMANVTGDILCTYSVASLEGLVDGEIEDKAPEPKPALATRS
ncbi:dicarboxylate/amino acid:cation symporter [Uliginosibacterium gangwonense]|uniref:dicarboxylate/amino acid:cation symporter n=1 Tax=Uliginosibacterium gangwonense TaxID=392736 RepID=UPI00037914C6|nr:dicarboxylate/amino acid:cation symporter [Uliginosibacterium gangwonense]